MAEGIIIRLRNRQRTHRVADAGVDTSKRKGRRRRVTGTRREPTHVPGKCEVAGVELEEKRTRPGCARDPQRPRGHAEHTDEPALGPPPTQPPTDEPAQQQREPRKLHRRWWHAGRPAMERISQAAVPPTSILAKAADMVEAYRECRTWRRLGPNPTAAVELITKQNEVVDADILFYKGHMTWHMVDRSR